MLLCLPPPQLHVAAKGGPVIHSPHTFQMKIAIIMQSRSKLIFLLQTDFACYCTFDVCRHQWEDISQCSAYLSIIGALIFSRSHSCDCCSVKESQRVHVYLDLLDHLMNLNTIFYKFGEVR